MLSPVVVPHGEDSLGTRLPSWLLLPGLWLLVGQTGKGQLPSWFWQLVLALGSSAASQGDATSNFSNCGILKCERSDQSWEAAFSRLDRFFERSRRMGVDVVFDMREG